MGAPTSARRKLEFLDGFRGMAILAVALFHALGAAFGRDRLPWQGVWRTVDPDPVFTALAPLTYGNLGVAIFFAVSGCVITLSQRHDGSWTSFFVKRTFRIYPPYLAALLLFAFVWPWGDLSLDADKRFQLGTHLLLVHNLFDGAYYGINASFWSVAVEWQLYALLPVLVWLARRWGWGRTVLGLLLVETALRAGVGVYEALGHAPPPRWVLGSPLAYWGSWSAGAYVAVTLGDGRQSWFRRLRVDLLFALTLASILTKVTAHLAFPLAALTSSLAIDRLASGAWSAERLARSRPWQLLSAAGVVSYSFYLLHQPFLTYTELLAERLLGFAGAPTALPPLAIFAACTVMIPCVLVLSGPFKRLIEDPSADAGRILAARVSSPRAR